MRRIQSLATDPCRVLIVEKDFPLTRWLPQLEQQGVAAFVASDEREAIRCAGKLNDLGYPIDILVEDLEGAGETSLLAPLQLVRFLEHLGPVHATFFTTLSNQIIAYRFLLRPYPVLLRTQPMDRFLSTLLPLRKPLR